MLYQSPFNVLGVLTIAASAALTTSSIASWPTTPDDPLVLGAANVTQSAYPGLAKTDDQATWIAWMDNQCFGNLRVQRVDASGQLLAPGGLVVDTLGGCHTMSALMTACADGSVVFTRHELNAVSFETLRVHRYAADGSPLWGTGFTFDIDGNGQVRGLSCLPNGDVLIVLQVGQTMQVHRIDPDANAVWDEPAIIAGSAVSLTVVPDAEGGAMLAWDVHASPSYFRVIIASKITADGRFAWPDITRVVTPEHPFASRHTPHSFVPDGEGGLWISYTRGGTQVDTPRPIDVQRLRADGTLQFSEPLRVSDSLLLQTAATAWRDAATGDLLVAWRDGGFDAQTLRVQRLTPKGDRLFGTTGIMVRPLTPTVMAHLITGHWTGETLLLSVADAPETPDGARVRMHRIAGDGAVDPQSSPLSGPEDAFALQNVAHGDNQVVLWMREIANFQMEPVIHLVQPDGTLGLPTVPGDLDGNGVVDVSDLLVLLANWGTCPDKGECIGDINNDGSVDVSDLLLLLANWG